MVCFLWLKAYGQKKKRHIWVSRNLRAKKACNARLGANSPIPENGRRIATSTRRPKTSKHAIPQKSGFRVCGVPFSLWLSGSLDGYFFMEHRSQQISLGRIWRLQGGVILNSQTKTRSSSREDRIRVPTFSVVYLRHGEPSQPKKG